jgi:hypothetical protein
MRLRAHRRNLAVWSPFAGSAGRYGSPGPTRLARTRRIRRCIRTGTLLAVVGLITLTRGGRARWWLLLAGGVLTVAGFMLRGAASGMVFLPGLMCLAFAPLVPARAKTDRRRRSELERELGVSPSRPWPPTTTGFRSPAGINWPMLTSQRRQGRRASSVACRTCARSWAGSRVT